jgi:hypothetical protein
VKSADEIPSFSQQQQQQTVAQPVTSSRKVVASAEKTVVATRGGSCELGFRDRALLSAAIKQSVGNVVRLSLLLEMDASLFQVGFWGFCWVMSCESDESNF